MYTDKTNLSFKRVANIPDRNDLLHIIHKGRDIVQWQYLTKIGGTASSGGLLANIMADWSIENFDNINLDTRNM